MSLATCRMCLSAHTHGDMFHISNTPLQDVYERITNIQLHNVDGMPVTACYICHHLLKKSKIFIDQSVKANEHLQQALKLKSEDVKDSHFTFNIMPLKTTLCISPVEFTNFDHCVKPIDASEIEIKIEKQADIEVKKELLETESSEDLLLTMEMEIEMNEPFVKLENQSDAFEGCEAMTTAVDKIEEEKADGSLVKKTGARVTKTDMKTGTLNQKDQMTKKDVPNQNYIEISTDFAESIPAEVELHYDNVSSVKQAGLNLYQCTHCNKLYKRKDNLSLHLRTHMGEKPFLCSHCNAAYISKKHLTAHLKTHTDEKLYRCHICDQAFKQSGTLTAHMRTHTGEKPYQCNKCSKRFTRKNVLTNHMRIHTGEKPFHCNHCNKDFSQKSTFRIHTMTHSGDLPYKCDDCDKRFAVKKSFMKHIKIHTDEKPYQCNDCDKRYSDRSTLKTHCIRKHTDSQAKYCCNYCGGEFNHKTSFIAHIKTHTEQQILQPKYCCTHCGKEFNRKSTLTRHIKIHTDERPYHCNYCSKDFRSRTNLMNHIRTHTDERPYRCSYCTKGFNRKSTLDIHTRIHTGEKPYHCSHCEKSFSDKCSLLLHIRVHTGEKPYHCTYCGKRYKGHSDLRRHMRFKHIQTGDLSKVHTDKKH